MAWHNAPVANNSGEKAGKKRYVDNGWPQDDNGDAADHAVSELATHISGALSPFGEVEFPLPVDDLPFVQSKTVVNR
ncbi:MULTISPECIES: hypothetical protein [Gordonia]|uniref:Uncharacterized protein n=1 Tax=Gordonia amicalis TaxID=89053 RepID=A0AAE4RC90_9ACTN|nr:MULTISPECIES: hypothetical protein [Gordonia]ATD69872.1 hypothetical protein CNO18_05905 [Gordonia sp. 1D]MBA5847173.1 hypothetical protein [Gordonia amicalis]MCR8898567.1 hypothetical protein [Gordonia sp. GONU]MCZ0911927.1 hypothetical protein [Gordonia amicalis]MCZ4581439.1 hypothetical protein [Gordonia amicalis]